MAAHIAHCQQPSVKQEQHAKKSKEEPKGSKGNANLCRGARTGCQAVSLASTHSGNSICLLRLSSSMLHELLWLLASPHDRD